MNRETMEDPSCATCKWYMAPVRDGASHCVYFVGLKLPSCFRGLRTRVVHPNDGGTCRCWEKRDASP